jgi:DNA-binding MarR family transcriptional regulator/GNAT superfamily N-acetyltransferase
MPIPRAEVEEVRAFNRDYTRRIGVLSQRFQDSPYTLTQARVLYEIAHRPGVNAAELVKELGLDAGYLSRILKEFEGRRLLKRTAASSDARRQHLRLTADGRRVFAPLERAARASVRTLLGKLELAERRSLLAAMRTIRDALAAERMPLEISLRAHGPGDMGWVTERHGALYFETYAWNTQFEAMVAGITADFIRKFDPARERCWIAESHGRRLGCIFLVNDGSGSARLRLLMVEPAARGAGLGARLVSECVSFARSAGYQRILLWTHANLSAARHLYERAGFRCTSSEPSHSFGHDLVSEHWELDLKSAAVPATRRMLRTVNG